MKIEIPRLTAFQVKVTLRQMMNDHKTRIANLRNETVTDADVAQELINCLVQELNLLQMMYDKAID